MPNSPSNGRRPGVPKPCRAYANSQCHRCVHNTHVITGKGSLFLKCSARAPKYQPQPQMRCPVFAPMPYVQFGETLLAWAGAPLVGPVAVEIRGDIWACPLDQPTANALPGDGLAWIDGGIRWVMTPTRMPTLGWRIAGPPPAPAVGTHVWLKPVILAR